jgi:hypothetical protein
MSKITIEQAKRWREEAGATHLVVFSVDKDGSQHVATHGESELNAAESAKAGNALKSFLGWPEDLCRAKPVQRVCKNCTFYRPDYGVFCVNGWSGNGSKGNCLCLPGSRPSTEERDTCSMFQPKG